MIWEWKINSSLPNHGGSCEGIKNDFVISGKFHFFKKKKRCFVRDTCKVSFRYIIQFYTEIKVNVDLDINCQNMYFNMKLAKAEKQKSIHFQCLNVKGIRIFLPQIQNFWRVNFGFSTKKGAYNIKKRNILVKKFCHAFIIYL